MTDITKNYSSPKSFELLVVNILGKSSTTTLINIYRPQSSSLSVFLEELSELIQNLTLSGERWIIGCDVNCPGYTSTTVDQGLLNILEMFDLRQWVTNEMHDRGGLLDVMITHVDVDFILGDVAIDMVGFSDHVMLSLDLNLIKDHRSMPKTTKQRSFKNFDHDQFKELFLKTSVVMDPADNVDGYIEQFNESMVKVLDVVAPMRIVTNRRSKEKSPWLSEAAEKAKRERKWKQTKSEPDRVAYRTACRSANSLIAESRKNFFSNMIAEASTNMRTRAVPDHEFTGYRISTG